MGLLIIFLSWFLGASWFSTGPLFISSWYLVAILLTYSLWQIIKNNHINDDYLFALLANYLFWHGYLVFNFGFHNYSSSLICLIANIIFAYSLFKESKKVDKVAMYYLIPYLFLLFYLLITQV